MTATVRGWEVFDATARGRLGFFISVPVTAMLQCNKEGRTPFQCW